MYLHIHRYIIGSQYIHTYLPSYNRLLPLGRMHYFIKYPCATNCTFAVTLLYFLHWLPFHHRIDFKLAKLAFHTRSSATRSYLNSSVVRYFPFLCSQHILAVPITKQRLLGVTVSVQPRVICRAASGAVSFKNCIRGLSIVK